MANTDFGAAVGRWHVDAGSRPRSRTPDSTQWTLRQVRGGLSPAGEAGTASLDAPEFRPYRDIFKRVLDISLILLALPIVLPLIGLLALVIARDGHSPFFRQERVGRNGRVFSIWKLRTMVPDAERILEQHLERCPDKRREWDANQKLRNDPRITPVGGLLRRISFDELPQLWNVLKGEMSLVGPRPMMPCQQSLYPGAAYYALRPGLTGFWQISKRNESTFAERAGFDTAYEQAVSLKTDVKILVWTVGVVMRGTGL